MPVKYVRGKDIVYSVRNLAIGKTIEDYDFRKGEISTFVLVNHTERMRVFHESE